MTYVEAHNVKEKEKHKIFPFFSNPIACPNSCLNLSKGRRCNSRRLRPAYCCYPERRILFFLFQYWRNKSSTRLSRTTFRWNPRWTAKGIRIETISVHSLLSYLVDKRLFCFAFPISCRWSSVIHRKEEKTKEKSRNGNSAIIQRRKEKER